MHAIAQEVSLTESRLDAWVNSSAFDNPFMVGQDGGSRVWHRNEQMIHIDNIFRNNEENRK